MGSCGGTPRHPRATNRPPHRCHVDVLIRSVTRRQPNDCTQVQRYPSNPSATVASPDCLPRRRLTAVASARAPVPADAATRRPCAEHRQPVDRLACTTRPAQPRSRAPAAMSGSTEAPRWLLIWGRPRAARAATRQAGAGGLRGLGEKGWACCCTSVPSCRPGPSRRTWSRGTQPAGKRAGGQ